MEQRFRIRTIIYVFATFVVLLSTTYLCYLVELDLLLDGFLDINYFDLLSGQVANTLIVLSLTSVLSSNFGQVYWIDIKETKLIEPFWGCFVGITVYLLTGLVYSAISYAFEFKVGMVISVAVSTILLMILTFKMISIYFGKEEIKKQLYMEYTVLFILSSTGYVSDYYRKLDAYISSAKKQNFRGKQKLISNLTKELKSIKSGINSVDEVCVERCHTEYIEKHIKGLAKREMLDSKITEYTRNAIKVNDCEVIKDNIDLLIDAGNYDSFFDLLDELFEWDEKYTCKILRKISKEKMNQRYIDRVEFFKRYALSKLISQTGNLDALQNLLLIYDPSNLGMRSLTSQIKQITDECLIQKKKWTQYDLNMFDNEADTTDSPNKHFEIYENLKETDARLANRLNNLLNSASTKELRAFYIPIKEASIAYDEGKYEIANRYISVILYNFDQDIMAIKALSGIEEVRQRIDLSFSYLFGDEVFYSEQLIQNDTERMAIPDEYKKKLLGMQKVTIDNGLD